jgi:hypothetical protein
LQKTEEGSELNGSEVFLYDRGYANRFIGSIGLIVLIGFF